MEENSFVVKILEDIELKKLKKLLKEDYSVKSKKDLAYQDVYFSLDNDNVTFILHDMDDKQSTLEYILEDEIRVLEFPIKREDFIDILSQYGVSINFILDKGINRDEIDEILENLNFVKLKEIFVKRSIFENDKLKLTIDNVEDLGNFVIFKSKNISLSEKFILKNLGFVYEKFENKSYLDEFNLK